MLGFLTVIVVYSRSTHGRAPPFNEYVLKSQGVGHLFHWICFLCFVSPHIVCWKVWLEPPYCDTFNCCCWYYLQ